MYSSRTTKRAPMRLRSVFAKTVYDRRHGLLWWSVGIGLLTVAVLSVWPSVRDEYQKLVQNYPEPLLAFFGIDKAGVGTAAGYLQAELFGFMLPLMLIAYMIAAASAATAGEREAGSLELLLAQPVSRTRVLVQKYAALCASLALITAAFAGVLIVGSRVFDLGVAVSGLAAATLSAYVLAALFGAIALLTGCLTGHRALAAGVAAGSAVAAYLLASLAALVEVLRRFRPVSPFWWYSGNGPLRHGLQPLHVGLLVGATLLCMVAAVIVFDRRDLG
jgi:beta-exotoxin I transport system permease protein